MKLHNLTPAAGSVNKEKGRLGRGEGSGSGGTASKGHKGDYLSVDLKILIMLLM